MRCPRRSENPSSVWKYPEEDTWRDDDTCSYCGCYKPDLLLDAIRSNMVELGPTDKNYKVYLKFESNREKKFYFQHFSIEQQKEFIALLNLKEAGFSKVRFSYPGHFYVLPYFASKEGG